MAAQLHFGAGDSVAFGTTGTSGSGTASFAKSALSNLVIGDLLVAWIHNQTNLAGSTITPPAGWTRYGAALEAPTSSATRLSGFYYYAIKSQADIDNLSATCTWTFSVSGNRCACVVARATGIDLDNIEDSASTAFQSSSASAALSITGITTVKPTTLLIAGTHHQNAISTTSPTTTALLTSFQEYKTSPTGSANANSGATMGYQYLTSAGATGNVASSIDSVAAIFAGELVAFKAGAWSPPGPVGRPIKYTSALDTLSTGQAFYTSGVDTLAVPLEVRPVPTGYASVAAMLAATPFYAAHRGGSLDWPEMSLHAYTQSVFWGVGALELSLARTSDGVWFGLHDDTLDRTSGTTGFTASAHTWAEVQAYQITAAATNNPGQPTRPYMRWEELMTAYYATHIIFVDPKAALAFTAELLNMMDAMPGTPTDRFVGKYYGVVGNVGNTTGWPHDLRARGYKGWGYFYQADVPNLATYQGRWDILGMDYNADQPSWDAVKSYGKPVIGHIVPSAAAATTAFTKGANGLMVSGVMEAVPRST